MYIYPYIVHFCVDRHPYGLSTRPDGQKTPTCQSATTNNAPRYPHHVPVISNHAQARPNLHLFLHISICYSHIRQHCKYATAATISRPFLCQLSDAISPIQIGGSALVTLSDSTRLAISTWFDSVFQDSIQLLVHAFIFYFIPTI